MIPSFSMLSPDKISILIDCRHTFCNVPSHQDRAHGTDERIARLHVRGGRGNRLVGLRRGVQVCAARLLGFPLILPTGAQMRGDAPRQRRAVSGACDERECPPAGTCRPLCVLVGGVRSCLILRAIGGEVTHPQYREPVASRRLPAKHPPHPVPASVGWSASRRAV